VQVAAFGDVPLEEQAEMVQMLFAVQGTARCAALSRE
jgi:hypothetical protein